MYSGSCTSHFIPSATPWCDQAAVAALGCNIGATQQPSCQYECSGSQAADKAPDEDQQLQMEQLIVEMDDLVERLRSKVAWLDMVSLPARLLPLHGASIVATWDAYMVRS